jgi:hypothetical protein
MTRDDGDRLNLNCFNAAQQLVRRLVALSLIAIDFFAVNGHDHISGAAGLDTGFDSELGLRGFLQAHGRAAQIHSKETALDFDFHRDHLFAFIVLQSGTKRFQHKTLAGGISFWLAAIKVMIQVRRDTT